MPVTTSVVSVPKLNSLQLTLALWSTCYKGHAVLQITASY